MYSCGQRERVESESDGLSVSTVCHQKGGMYSTSPASTVRASAAPRV